MKKNLFKIMLALLWLTAGNAYCQQVNYRKLEQIIGAAYTKAYPACVELYAYDTIARQQAGGVFSGVVVSKDGYILTTAHVTIPGVVYKVNFPDGKTCLATGLGKIEFLQDKTLPDVAMIRITTPGTWPFAAIGNSSSLKINEPCISIAYPESLAQPKPVLRFGYITAKLNNRGFIKSTCIMEPGDSGGPLFDYEGNVIGLHSAIEVAEDSNYDVPVDLYLKYWTALNKPVIYTAYPEVIDPIPVERPNVNLISLPGLANNKTVVGKNFAYAKSCVAISSHLNGSVQQVLGTLFSLQGLASKEGRRGEVIVSKSSLVGDEPVIINIGKSEISARVVSRDKANDLVLLLPGTAIKGGINHQVAAGEYIDTMKAGKFLVSALPGAPGIISIAGSSIFPVVRRSNAPFLGIGFKNKTGPLIIGYLFPNLNKSIYQLKIGDQLLSINKDTSSTLKGYLELLKNYWPGDSVKLAVNRSGTTLYENIVLDTIPSHHSNHPAEFFAGGKSYRKDGFDTVFTHDAVLKPAECGGPVFDLDGNFCGLNIARYSRAACLALPATVVYQFINHSLKDSKQADVLFN